MAAGEERKDEEVVVAAAGHHSSLIVKQSSWRGFTPKDLKTDTGHAIFFPEIEHPIFGKVIVKLNKTEGYASTQEVCGGVLMKHLSASHPDESRIKTTYLLVDDEGNTLGVVIPLIGTANAKFKDYTDVNITSVIAETHHLPQPQPQPQVQEQDEVKEREGAALLPPIARWIYVNDHERVEEPRGEWNALLLEYEATLEKIRYDKALRDYPEAKAAYDARVAQDPAEAPEVPAESQALLDFKVDHVNFDFKSEKSKAFKKLGETCSKIKKLQLREKIYAYFSDETPFNGAAGLSPEEMSRYKLAEREVKPTTLGEHRRIEAYEKHMEFVFLRYLLGEDDGHKGNYGFTFDDAAQKLTIEAIDFDQILYPEIAARYADLRRKNQLGINPYDKHDFFASDIQAFPILDGQGANPGFHPGQQSEGFSRGIIWTPNKGKYTENDVAALKSFSSDPKFVAAAWRAKTTVAKRFLNQDPRDIYDALRDMSHEGLTDQGVRVDASEYDKIDYARAYTNAFMKRRRQFVKEVANLPDDNVYAQAFKVSVSDTDAAFKIKFAARSKSLERSEGGERNAVDLAQEIRSVESQLTTQQDLQETLSGKDREHNQLKIQKTKVELLKLNMEQVSMGAAAHDFSSMYRHFAYQLEDKNTDQAIQQVLNLMTRQYAMLSHGNFVPYAMDQVAWSVAFDDEQDPDKARKARGVQVLQAIANHISQDNAQDFESLIGWFKRVGHSSSFITDVRKPSIWSVYFTRNVHHNRHTQTYSTMRDILLHRALELQTQDPSNPIYAKAINDLQDLASWRSSPSVQAHRLTGWDHCKLSFRQYFLNSNNELTWANWKQSKVDPLQKSMVSASGAVGLFFKLLLIVKDIPIFLLGGISVLASELGHSVLSQWFSTYHDNSSKLVRGAMLTFGLIPLGFGLGFRILGGLAKVACNLMFNPMQTAESVQRVFDEVSVSVDKFFIKIARAFESSCQFSWKLLTSGGIKSVGGFFLGLVCVPLFLASLLTMLVVEAATHIGRGFRVPYFVSLVLSGVSVFFAGKAILAGLALTAAAGVAAAVSHGVGLAATWISSFAAAHMAFLVSLDVGLFGVSVAVVLTPIMVAITPFYLNNVSKKAWQELVGLFNFIKRLWTGEPQKSQKVSSGPEKAAIAAPLGRGSYSSNIMPEVADDQAVIQARTTGETVNVANSEGVIIEFSKKLNTDIRQALNNNDDKEQKELNEEASKPFIDRIVGFAEGLVESGLTHGQLEVAKKQFIDNLGDVVKPLAGEDDAVVKRMGVIIDPRVKKWKAEEGDKAPVAGASCGPGALRAVDEQPFAPGLRAGGDDGA